MLVVLAGHSWSQRQRGGRARWAVAHALLARLPVAGAAHT